MSHYDTNLNLAGFAGTTHKITEGTGYVDPTYATRMNSYRASHASASLVLGSYHVLHSKDLTGQLRFWLDQQDRLTPWWRDWPHWIMQIDAERWPTDNVSPSTVITFARMLANADVPGLKVCYASRGQYGDSLAGIPLPLWNAAYHTSTYPGDNSPDWRPYSGQTPMFWQYTSTPYDKNAFRGSVADLLAYIEGGDLTTVDLTPAALAAVADAVKKSLTASSDFTDDMGGNHNPISDAVWNAKQIPGAQNKRANAWQVLAAVSSLPTSDDIAAAFAPAALAGPLAAALAPLLPTGVQVTQEQLQAAFVGALKELAGTA